MCHVQLSFHLIPTSVSKIKSAWSQVQLLTNLLIIGAVPGQQTVSGARWLELSYGYSANHIWRNLGIILAFFIFFTFTFLAAVEWSSPPESHGEVLVFQKGKEPGHLADSTTVAADEESGHAKRLASRDEAARTERRSTIASVQEMKKELHIPKDVFTWKNVCCDVMIKGQPRRLLSNVFGYVKPGTLTALMGESGAGKTTLLDTYSFQGDVADNSLAQRNESGIISGDMLVNGKPLPAQFQRSCGYVQQQDVIACFLITDYRFIWRKVLYGKHFGFLHYFVNPERSV
jgi:ATP-binding cassette, subfamily G (WHITE), member 2, PDR